MVEPLEKSMKSVCKRIWVRPFDTKNSINLFGDDEADDCLKNVLLKKRTEFPRTLMDGLLWQPKGVIKNFNVTIKTPNKSSNQSREPIIKFLNDRMADLARSRGYNPTPGQNGFCVDQCTCYRGPTSANPGKEEGTGGGLCSCSSKKRMMEFKTTKPCGNVTIKAELNNQTQDMVIQADKMTVVMEELDARKTGIDIFVRDCQGRIKLARTINVLDTKGDRESSNKKGSVIQEINQSQSRAGSGMGFLTPDLSQLRSPTTSRSPQSSLASVSTSGAREYRISGGEVSIAPAPKGGILVNKSQDKDVSSGGERPRATSKAKSRKIVRSAGRSDQPATTQPEDELANGDKSAAVDGGDKADKGEDGLQKKVRVKGKKRYEKLKAKEVSGDKDVPQQKEKHKKKKMVKDKKEVVAAEKKEGGKIEKKKKKKKTT